MTSVLRVRAATITRLSVCRDPLGEIAIAFSRKLCPNLSQPRFLARHECFAALLFCAAIYPEVQLAGTSGIFVGLISQISAQAKAVSTL